MIDTDEDRDVLTILEAFVREGQLMADLTADFLDRWTASLGWKHAPRFPAEFLLELSAILRVGLWQKSGIASELEPGFPPVLDLLMQLIQRFCEAPLTFSCDVEHCSSPLVRQVQKTWFRQFSWSSPMVLGVEVLVRRRNTEALLEGLADLLWENRHLIHETRMSNASAPEE